MAAALEQVIELFKGRDWKFKIDEKGKFLHSSIAGDNGQWDVLISAPEHDQVCLMLSVFPQKCPPQRRSACAELLSRINYSLLVGCFEMDFNTGRINFKTSLPFTEEQLDSELLEKVVMFNINFMDKFRPAIMSVIYADTPPARALAKIEKKTRQSRKQASMPKRIRRRFLNN